MSSFGKYEVVELIGEGGFGQVYRGWDPQLKRPVAIKTVSLSISLARERFMREAEIAAGLRHPCIVSIYDFGEQDGIPYLVQEFLSGEDLAQKILRGDRIDYATRIRWMMDAAEGLAFAHARGIVHRDIKPSNIRVLDDGSVRIMDFGIAKLIDTQQQLTGTSLSVGTSGYIAPEQLEGKDIDQRADIFSFGAMAYELTTYHKPFLADSIQATLYKILTEEPPPIRSFAPDCPARLAGFIETCLRKRRDERYPDLTVALADLRGALQEAEPGRSPAAAPAPAVESDGPAETRPAGAAAAGPGGASSQPDLTVPFGSGSMQAVESGTAEQPRDGLRLQKLAIVGGALAVLLLVGWAGASLLGGVLGRGDRPSGDDGFGTGGTGDSTTVVLADSMTADSMPADSLRLADTGGMQTGGADPGGGSPAGGAEAASGTGATSTGGASPTGSSGVPDAGRTGGGADPSRTGSGAVRTTSETSSGAAGGSGTQASGGGTGATGASNPATGGAPGGGTGTTVDPRRVLVLVRGERSNAVGVVQTTVFTELTSRERPFVDPSIVDRIRASETAMQALEAGGSPAAAVGREYGAGTVVIANLSADASPGVGGFVTGSAIILARYYDTASGRLLFSERYQVGAGGVPGRPGVSELDAISQAAESVARQMARAIVQKTGGG